VGSRAPTVGGTTGHPAPGRRYEAIVVLGVSDLPPLALRALGSLSAAGAAIGVVTSAGTADLVGRLTTLAGGPGPMVITSSTGQWCATTDGTGTATVARRDVPDATEWVMAELWERGIGPADALAIGPGAEADDGAVAQMVIGAAADQVARRARSEVPEVRPGQGWGVTADGLAAERARVEGTLFALADGEVGTSGALVASSPGQYRWVLAAGVYVGDGPGTRLLTAPVAMQLPYELAAVPEVRRVLDLHAGVVREEVLTSRGRLVTVRFCSLARPGTSVFRSACPDPPDAAPKLLTPVDDGVLDAGTEGDLAWARAGGTPGGVAAAAVDLPGTGEAHSLDRVAVYVAAADRLPTMDDAVRCARSAASTGFDALLAEHRAAWAERWSGADVTIDGDDDLQRAVRFALFHLMASAADRGEASVGARGLTGTGYRGHVFWDADTFVLPFLAATHPASARALLEYRLRRLPAARAAARELGRQGARFPWESAHSGRDVTPTSARDRAGRTVAIRTGQLEEHIVAQVAWAACWYTDWTGDVAFARGPGLDLLVETARYWASRVREEPDGAHIYGVIGPDEYHEPVDDNAFTNVMARWNLRRAADALLAGAPAQAMAQEAERWRMIAARLVDGFDPGTGIYEQFAGFHDLEPLIIAEIAPRRPIVADLLLGARRVHGAQVIKQADVLMLHHLVPEEVEAGTLEPNLGFYEPRTAHGSSLSPGVHASLFARARSYDRALEALTMASRLDLDDLTGTTGGGLHLATMGSVWQALAFGFAGLRPHDGALVVDPRLPPRWAALEVHVRFHGTRTHVRVEHGGLTVETDGPLRLLVEGTSYQVDARRLALRRRPHAWEEAR
jgi:trehalose/maltose hydrolase-like predicted phosphorylase